MIGKSTSHNRGFTLIEMMVVIAVILILLSIALPIYSQTIIHAREVTLRKNLETLNVAIARYTLDKKKAPQSLNDLMHVGYIESIPQDITGREDTWALEQDDSIFSLDQTDSGVSGVHSGSDQMGLDGTAYSTW